MDDSLGIKEELMSIITPKTISDNEKIRTLIKPPPI